MPALWLTANRMPQFGFLLAAMFLELMLAPLLLDTNVGGFRAARVMTAIVLLAALPVVGLRLATLALFIPALIAQVVASYSSATSVLVASAMFRLLFLCYVVAILVWRVLRDRIVTLDTLAGAACAYMFLGSIWGDLYLLVEYWRPGSFDIPSSFAVGPERDLRAALIYFSFITLTTVAYGTIHPMDPGVGILCAAEALVGQLYLAIMIARMVGLHIAERTR